MTFYDFTASVTVPDAVCLSGFGEVHARATANGDRHGTPVLLGPGGWPDPRVNLYFRTGPMAEARPGTWRRYAYALVVWLNYLHVVGRGWVEATAGDVEAFKEWRLTSLDNAGRVQPAQLRGDTLLPHHAAGLGCQRCADHLGRVGPTGQQPSGQ